MTVETPKPTAGMRHVALFVKNFDDVERFYVDLLKMKVEWRPDADNLYLSSGNDNLALHRCAVEMNINPDAQKLDHIGFIIDDMDQVNVWYDFLVSHNIKMRTEPKTHRDGARSFYCEDPDGTLVQMIYHPPISGQSFLKK